MQTAPWSPVFTGYDGEQNVQVADFWFAIGMPDCGPMQMWPIYHYYMVWLLCECIGR